MCHALTAALLIDLASVIPVYGKSDDICAPIKPKEPIEAVLLYLLNPLCDLLITSGFFVTWQFNTPTDFPYPLFSR